MEKHHELEKIWPMSECTLRVIMVKMPQESPYDKAKWHNIIAYARFGSSVSGGASNLSSGGIGIGFDFFHTKISLTSSPHSSIVLIIKLIYLYLMKHLSLLMILVNILRIFHYMLLTT